MKRMTKTKKRKNLILIYLYELSYHSFCVLIINLDYVANFITGLDSFELTLLLTAKAI